MIMPNINYEVIRGPHLKVVMRNDLERRWNQSAFILRPGEIVLSAQDDGRLVIKIGDGTHTYAELPEANVSNLPDETYVYWSLPGGRSPDKMSVGLISQNTKTLWEQQLIDTNVSLPDFGDLL